MRQHREQVLDLLDPPAVAAQRPAPILRALHHSMASACVSVSASVCLSVYLCVCLSACGLCVRARQHDSMAGAFACSAKLNEVPARARKAAQPVPPAPDALLNGTSVPPNDPVAHENAKEGAPRRSRLTEAIVQHQRRLREYLEEHCRVAPRVLTNSCCTWKSTKLFTTPLILLHNTFRVSLTRPPDDVGRL